MYIENLESPTGSVKIIIGSIMGTIGSIDLCIRNKIQFNWEYGNSYYFPGVI
jgi:hypothetical protein